MQEDKIVAALVTTLEQLSNAQLEMEGFGIPKPVAFATIANSVKGATILFANVEKALGFSGEVISAKLDKALKEKLAHVQAQLAALGEDDDSDPPPCGYDPSKLPNQN